jgi:hypothetical protein
MTTLTNYRVGQLLNEALVEAGKAPLNNPGPQVYNRRKTSEPMTLEDAVVWIDNFVASYKTGTRSTPITLAELRASVE